MSHSQGDHQSGLSAERLEAIRRSWGEARVTPLWETGVHRVAQGAPRGHHWRWTDIRPLIDDAIAVTTTENAERRVLALNNPDARGGRNTATNINANFQVLAPGETARPHRHTANALRFVVEGSGGITTVDGKECLMTPGDLVITPGGSWHEHAHRGEGTLVWLDVLDVPLHQYLGTQVFEPGPAHDLPPTIADSAFAGAGLAPVLEGPQTAYSPLFRFPKAAWEAALQAAPAHGDGARSIRIINPLTGAPAMPLMDCRLMRISKGQPTAPIRSNANAACFIVSGHGRSRVGDEVFDWAAHDVFTMPGHNVVSHECLSEDATLFFVSDREVLRRLDLLVEERVNAKDMKA